MKKWIAVVLGILVLIGGYVVYQSSPSKDGGWESLKILEGSQTSESERAKQACIQACENALEEGRDLSEGPCLIDPMKGGKWVCDVANEPRQPVDNKRENQCDAWHNGTAEHFIEVMPDCEFIRTG